jgi:hypothetical protein
MRRYEAKRRRPAKAAAKRCASSSSRRSAASQSRIERAPCVHSGGKTASFACVDRIKASNSQWSDYRGYQRRCSLRSNLHPRTISLVASRVGSSWPISWRTGNNRTMDILSCLSLLHSNSVSDFSAAFPPLIARAKFHRIPNG